MRIAIVDHSFHEKTASSAFFIELLEEIAEVTVFWDDSWTTGRVDPELVRGIADPGFDRIIFYQVFWPASLLAWLGIEVALYVPMYDDVRKKSSEWWEGYRGSSFVSFSRALDPRLKEISHASLPVQFYPPPVESTRPTDGGLVAFFWQRSRSLSWKTVFEIAKGNEWDRFHLHWALDPGNPFFRRPSQRFQERHSIRFSDWFDDPNDFFDLMASADVYFAPRLFEGIGMGFLEAMARGQCVVAPDSSTHNEYIISGENGVLYDPDSPQPAELENARELGEAARESCRNGHQVWLQQRKEIQEFVRNAPQEVSRERMERAVSTTAPDSDQWRVRRSIATRVAGRLARTVKNFTK